MTGTEVRAPRLAVNRSAITSFAFGIVVLLATGPVELPQAGETQLARRERKLDDEGTDIDGNWGTSGTRMRHGLKSSPGGYNAKHIKRFWRNYRGPKPKKEKEKEPKHGSGAE